MTTIKNANLIDIFKDEYHLDFQESVDESTDMMRYKQKRKPNRTSIIDDTVFLTDKEEQNECIAEQIAKKYKLKYFQQSCIAGTDEQLKVLSKAREEISQYMSVGDIESPLTPNGYYTKCFSFYS